jgi:phthiocerol/phenolphthiocerol synthesis type-I polyketide synthase E
LLSEGTADVQRVQALEAAGAEVLLAAAPGWKETEIATAVALAEERWGGLDGAIHAAGVAGERTFLPIAATGMEEAAWHFQPKAHGLLALDRALAGRRLDFRVAVSSLAAVVGGVGYAAYAASNLFVDAFVQSCAGRGDAAWLGIHWDAWGQEGAPLGEAAVTPLAAGLAPLAMTPAEGGEVFRRILAAATGEQVTVSTAALPERIAQAQQRAESRALAAGSAAGAERHPRPALATPFAVPETELEQAIAEVWRRILGFAEVGANDNFFEIGGDSFIAVRMASELQQALAREIPVAKLYQGLTIRALAQLLAPEAGAARERLAEHLAERRESMDRRQEFLAGRRAARRAT